MKEEQQRTKAAWQPRVQAHSSCLLEAGIRRKHQGSSQEAEEKAPVEVSGLVHRDYGYWVTQTVVT